MNYLKALQLDDHRYGIASGTPWIYISLMYSTDMFHEARALEQYQLGDKSNP